MKFAVLVVAAAGMGAIATVAVPSSVIRSGASQMQVLEERAGRFKLADLNPIRAVYDWEAEQIKKPVTPEELGIHHQELTLRPIDMRTTDSFHRLDLNNFGRNGYRDVSGSIQQAPH